MGDNLTKLTVGTVSRDVQLLTAGEGIDISATGVVSVDSDDFYTKTDVDTLLSDYYTKTEVDTELDNKVDKVTGKGLSTNDYTTAEKTKLAGIADGAEVNVQSDWNQTSTSADDFIKNKPTIPDVSDFYTKTQVDTALGNKVDKVTGKGLSANDYTNADKAIVDAVTTNLAGKQDKLTAGTNVQISSANVISATDTTYSAGQYISISSGNAISVSLTKANILSILGYKEATLSMTDIDGNTTTETILVKQ